MKLIDLETLEETLKITCMMSRHRSDDIPRNIATLRSTRLGGQIVRTEMRNGTEPLRTIGKRQVYGTW